jgi:hypothetical protein
MVFIKYYTGSVTNAKKTLQRKVNINTLITRINDQHLVSRLETYRSYGDLNFWDVGQRCTQHLKKGETLVIICKEDVYAAEIIDILHDAGGFIGDQLGWARQFKKPWTNVLLLNHLQMILKCRDSNLTKDFKKYCERLSNEFYQVRSAFEENFRKLLKDNSLKPNKTQADKTFEKEKVEDKKNPNATNKLDTLISSIENLKNDFQHSERDHESLVEKFFSFLGYHHEEIKYRSGRMDVLIKLNEKPMIVVEVKKYWNLTKKDDAVIQGYKYALENGVRYVLITNGDYYALYDRIQGLSFESNFVMEFTLSKLSKDNFSVFGPLRREQIESANELKGVVSTFVGHWR